MPPRGGRSMIETLPTKGLLSATIVPADVLGQFADFSQRLLGRSLIVWGEHCTECAYPDCYSRCAYYTPRPDLHCRRFEDGIQRLAVDLGLKHVRFRRWGKLEGAGPAPVVPIQAAAAAEGRDKRLSDLIAVAPAPFPLKRQAAWRWNRTKGRRAAAGSALRADGFVVETWAADGRSHPFTLTVLNVGAPGEDGSRMFQTRFDARPTYGRFTTPLTAIAACVDLHAPFLVQIEPVGEVSNASVVFGTCDFVAVGGGLGDADGSGSPALPPLGQTAQGPVKVVVWDLDDTLWSGVLADVGVEGVRLRPQSVSALRYFDERGIIQTIASKNDADEARAALDELGVADFFLCSQIHWGPKSLSLAAQARALDLGLDAFLLIDDQPFERGEVVAVHPQVRVCDPGALSDLMGHPWFDAPATTESRNRRALYRAEAARVEALESGAGDYEQFLRSASLRLLVRPLSQEDVERAYELSQRTNQLNFTGRKYGRVELRRLVCSADARRAFTLRCEDRFGDYGLIGLVVCEPSLGRVHEVFLSCRVQRKRVEHALFSWLSALVRAEGCSTLCVAHVPTARNRAASDILASLGFKSADPEGLRWTRPVEAAHPDDAIVAVTFEAIAPAA